MQQPLTTVQKHQLIRQATLASIVASVIIIIGKAIAWWITDSVSLFASLVDSLLDNIISVVNFMAVRYAMQPPDKEHRFGHGKAEDLAAFAQATLILISGIIVLFQAVKRFVIPLPPSHETIGIMVMVFATIIAMILVIFQRYVVQKTKSPVVKADSLHYLNDILVNGAVIISLLCAHFMDIAWVDTVFAILIAAYIAYGAWEIGVKSFHDLMDHEFDDEDRERIKAIIASHPSVKGWHRLKTRSSGGKPFIQFDVELDGNISLREAHAIADAIEQQMMQEFPDADVTIHQDPV